jgi:NADPH:quinone reductase-like Zn-dependent oxidoreductase
MADSIPKQMRAVVLEAYHANIGEAVRRLKVEERPVPTPRRGQVLVRIEAAPCNPSDLLLLQGQYGTLKTLPTVPGWEGAGAVVASGGGLFSRWLVGKRVACALPHDRDGTWAQYFVADAKDCIPLKAALPIEQAATFIVNPLTAVALLETARNAGHQAAVHTVAASQLGRMILTIAADMNYPMIHIARRDEQIEMLKSRGAEYVLNSSHENFADELKTLSQKLNTTAAFEAVAGEMTGTVLNAMPPKSTVYLYGALSEKPCSNIDPIAVVFHQKTLTGFYLGNWIRDRGFLGLLRAVSRVQRLLIERRIETTVQRRLALDEVVDGLLHYVDHMTDGKVLIVPHRNAGGKNAL